MFNRISTLLHKQVDHDAPMYEWLVTIGTVMVLGFIMAGAAVLTSK